MAALRGGTIPRPATGSSDGGVRLHDLFARKAATAAGSPAWRQLRDELVERNLALVYYLVRRFASRVDSQEDLRQVAIIGLIKAIDRFDHTRGVEFASYAAPTVLGELKRHLRDRGWAMRLPRRVQENVLAVGRSTTAVANRLGRSPTIAELAAETGLSEEEVLEAIEAQHSYSWVSLDAQMPAHRWDPDAVDPAQAALDEVENRAWLSSLLRRLEPREREIVLLRFFANMTQSQIAATIGVSQMHVSRLLNRALARLRET